MVDKSHGSCPNINAFEEKWRELRSEVYHKLLESSFLNKMVVE